MAQETLRPRKRPRQQGAQQGGYRPAEPLFQRQTGEIYLPRGPAGDTLPDTGLEGAVENLVRDDDHLQASGEAGGGAEGLSGGRTRKQRQPAADHRALPQSPRIERRSRRLFLRREDERVLAAARRRDHFIATPQTSAPGRRGAGR